MECEAKLMAPIGLPIPTLHGLVDGVRPTPPTVVHLEARYFDTADLRLSRAGATLRHRTGESGPPWTLKLPGTVQGSTLTRTEIARDGPGDVAPPALLDIARAYLRGAPVQPVAVLKTTRTVVRFCEKDGNSLAELADDIVQIVPVTAPAGDRVQRAGGVGPMATDIAGRSATSFREVEIELTDNGTQARLLLDRAVHQLRAAGFQTPDPMPKIARALGPAAQSPPDAAVGATPDADATAGQLARAALAGALVRMVRHDAGVRLGDDTEAVHQLRVAVRQLRSNLRSFGKVLDPNWVQSLRVELSWLGASLGAVRDADVLMSRLRRQIATLPETDRPAAMPILELLDRRRATSRRTLLTTLRSARYDALLDALVYATRPEPCTAIGGEQATLPASALHLVRRPWHRLVNQVSHFDQNPDDQGLHRTRVLAKRCRYAAEATEPVVGRPARRFADAMAQVQTLLGEHQDAVVAERWLRSAIAQLAAGVSTTHTRPAQVHDATLVCIGELIAIQQAARQGVRAQWPAAWKAASSDKLRSWI